MSPQYDKSQRLQDYKDVQDDLLNNIIEKRRQKEKERLENLQFAQEMASKDNQEHIKKKMTDL